MAHAQASDAQHSLPPAVIQPLVAFPPASAAHAGPFMQMLAHVYEENPQLKAERDNLRILDERVSAASGGFRPQLALSAGYGEARVSENNAAWQYGADRDAALTATQPIYNGATLGQWHAAKQRVLEGRARLLATEQKVLYIAIAAWIDMCEKEQLLALTLDNGKLMRGYLEATRQRLAAGDETETDLAIAESRAADNETKLAMAVSARDAAQATFQRATGLPVRTVDLPALPGDLPQSGADAIAAARKNPELAQADYEVAATEADIETAIGSREPSIFLRGSISDTSAEDLGLARLRSDSITINASLPLYAGGTEFAREREAKINHEKSRFDALNAARNVTEEAHQAWSRYGAAQSVIEASNRAAEAAEKALAGIEEEQKHGTRTLTEVLDAQSMALNARVTAVQAQINLRREAYRLMQAVGQLTARRLALPVTIYDPEAHYNDVASRWFGVGIDSANAASDEAGR